MSLLSFELRTPGSPCDWTGNRKNYVKVVRVGSGSLAKPGYYDYDFGDGWRAAVVVREVDGKTARKLRKDSDGFCGYDWMIDSIRYDGCIKARTRQLAWDRTQDVKTI